MGEENSPLVLVKGTSPCIPGSEYPWALSVLGAARAEAGARLGRRNLETRSGCGNNVSLVHTTSHSQAGDGLIITGEARGLGQQLQGAHSTQSHLLQEALQENPLAAKKTRQEMMAASLSPSAEITISIHNNCFYEEV